MQFNTDHVCYVITRFRALDEEALMEEPDAPEEPRFDLDHEEAFDELELHSGEDPLREELVAFIDGLPEEARQALVALTWIGRGDFDKEQWREARKAAAERDNSQTADYLLGMPRLADYLEDALAGFGQSCGDFDDSRM